MLLIGLDFGSTTSSAVVASAEVVRNCVTGRMEWGRLSRVWRSEPVFTPFAGDVLDEARLAVLLDGWLADSGVDPAEIASGGAIVTGLAAQAANAAAIGRLVRQRLGDAVIATADDPCLESWLAFMGNCLRLSQAYPQTPFINLDIGGGTTNLALGQAGTVQSVGCYYVGARHVQCQPGSYLLLRLSPYGVRMLHGLGIQRSCGDELRPDERARILDFYTGLLEAVVSGQPPREPRELTEALKQVSFETPRGPPPILTFSGGVGELVYAFARGEPRPGVTMFGDLGIDLAERIVGSPVLSRDLHTFVPETLGRATVYGLAIHNTELSGATLYLPHPEQLPLRDLPIVGRIQWPAVADPAALAYVDGQLRASLALARHAASGACLELNIGPDDGQAVKQLGERLAQALEDTRFPPDRPLVVLVSSNVGKTLGQYATRWGRLSASLIVLDEMPSRGAQFVSLGRMTNQLVPASFYGLPIAK
jgi:ethanolamine utilization protein EutA